MIRDIYLVVYPVKKYTKFNHGEGHWAIWIPEPDTKSGKIIHVIGSPFEGFKLEFKRSYILGATGTPFRAFRLASIDATHIKDTPGAVTDVTPTPLDTLETEATTIEAPKASPEPFNPNVGKRCQQWTREYIELLISRGILTQEVLRILDEAKALDLKPESQGSASSA